MACLGWTSSARARCSSDARKSTAAVSRRATSRLLLLQHVEPHALRWKRQVLPLRVDGMPSLRAIPIRDARRGFHLLDDLPPANARVVGAKADLAHLRAVRDDAHFGAAEIVVEEILEPHPR